MPKHRSRDNSVERRKSRREKRGHQVSSTSTPRRHRHHSRRRTEWESSSSRDGSRFSDSGLARQPIRQHTEELSILESVTTMGQSIKEGIEKLVSRCERDPAKVTNFSIATNIIENFDPNCKDVEEWLNAVDEYAFIYGWDDRTTSHLALTKLRGAAETWYRGLPTRLFTWAEWRELILKNFKQKHSLNAAIKNMMACTADRYLKLYDYHFAKLALIHKLRLPINDENQINLILGGIMDEQIKICVEASNICGVERLGAYFKILDEERIKSRRVADKRSHTVIASSSSANADSVQKQMRKPIFTTADTENSAVVCFKCKGLGHMRFNCPTLNRGVKPKQLALEYKNVNFIEEVNENNMIKDI
jgi:hypothetical protein